MVNLEILHFVQDDKTPNKIDAVCLGMAHIEIIRSLTVNHPKQTLRVNPPIELSQ